MKAHRWLSLLAALSLVVLAGCDWAQYGFDAGHGGWNPTEQTITPRNASTLSARWTGVGKSPVVAGGLVFSIHFDGLEAQDVATGARRWTRPPFPGENGGFGGPVVSGGTVYVTGWHITVQPDVYAKLHALDAATGAERWSVLLPNCPGALPGTEPTVGDGLVVVADIDHGICAVNAKTGTMAWSVALPGFGLKNAVAIAGGRVFAVGSKVYAFDERTGTLLWSRNRTSGGGTPVVAGGRLFIPGSGLSTFDPATGTPGWTSSVTDISEVAVTGDVVVATGPSAVRALDPATGTERWSVLGPSGTAYSRPAIANGVVFVWSFIGMAQHISATFCCAHMSALDLATGGELFSIPTDRAVSFDDGATRYPVVSGGTVYVGGWAGYSNSVGGPALRPSGV